MIDYSMLGAGAGLIPTLLKLLNGNSSTSGMTGGANVNNANNNIASNFQGTGQPADIVAAVSPNPTQSIQAYNADGGAPGTGAMTPLPAITNSGATNNTTGKTGGIADALSGLTGAFGGSGPSAVPAGATQMAAAHVAPVNYGGTGTRMAGDGGMGGGMMAPGQTALNPLPTGPAATNPLLLAFLKSRLGLGGMG